MLEEQEDVPTRMPSGASRQRMFDPSQPNQFVQQISNPARRGVTTGSMRREGTRTFAQVELGPHERVFISVDDLAPLVARSESLRELLENLRFGNKGDLARILTFHKISSNLSNVFYAMQASRTDFYAYQFKPVYKFIESVRGRILITDEVGLGKTIEAGLIWLEARARSDARRLLVVCPSMLREKWKQELRFRFNVKAELYDSQGLLRLLDDFRREGDNFECAAVCSLPSIRQEMVQLALATLEESPYRFDLVIIDEAHHMRNVKTKSHKAGGLLSELTESLVLLTATPLHLKNEDLFRLLSLLDPDEFNTPSLFETRLLANAPIVEAQNALRRIPADITSARTHISELPDSLWFQENPLVALVLSKLAHLESDDHEKLVEVGRLLEDLNLLASMVSRTRKREVQEWRVVRDPVVLGVDFNQQEMAFYKTVTEAVRARVGASRTGAIAAFSLMMPQRQMASCIAAMVEHYRQNPIEVGTRDEGLLDELGIPIDQYENEVNDAGSAISASLQTVIDNWDPNTPDSKFNALIKGLGERLQDPDSKVIVFSYFKKTLSYLQRRLRESGYRSVLIDGDVPMEDRLVRIEEFRVNPSIQVLLSSEVGSEGIDLQFCHLLVNYDLPWNPMKVEQRIGRLDRLGQRAEKITIINFSVHGTIEEKILERLYTRIGIFEKSLGDLEPILGAMVRELPMKLLSQSLTPEQEEHRITQTLQAIEAKRQQEAVLVDQSTVFFGTSDYILEQIGQARQLGRWITPEDLMSFIQDFFDNAYRGTRVSWDRPEKGLVSMNLSNDARNDFAQFCRLQATSLITTLTHPRSEAVILAFASDAAQKFPSYEFLSHFHPLVRWVIDYHRQDKKAFFPTSAVEVRTSLLPAGQYLCAIEFWTFLGLRKDVQIAYSVTPVGSKDIRQDFTPELLIREILSRGKTWEFADRVARPTDISNAWEACIAQLSADREEAFNTFRQKNLATTQRRRAHLESFLKRKEETLLKAVSTLEARGAPESQIRGFETRLTNTRESLQLKLRELEKESDTRDEFEEVAAVLCRILN
jgi:superfamily II DNA or RNA helicase